jgi:RNA polymerase sigma-70 factor, ECF subfamily
MRPISGVGFCGARSRPGGRTLRSSAPPADLGHLDTKSLGRVSGQTAGVPAAGRRDTTDLVEEYQQYIYRLALRLLRHPQDSEDATQDVLVRVIRFSPAFRNGSALATWLYRITYNVCMTRLRERGRSPLWNDRGALELAADHPWDRENDRLVVREAVRRLPARYRVPIALFFFDQLSHEQIARRLDMPVNTVKIRIHRGKRLLRQELSR